MPAPCSTVLFEAVALERGATKGARSKPARATATSDRIGECFQVILEAMFIFLVMSI
jgi:hypothetical protein